jgi:prolyl 4-hydroxylase
MQKAARAPDPDLAAMIARATAGVRAAALPSPLDGSDARILAQIGERVRAKLDAVPAAERIDAANVDMYVVHGFMSPEECAAMVALVDADLKPSQVFRSGSDPEFRTSLTCNLPRSQELVLAVEQRMAGLLGIALEQSETLQGQRYTPGQQFKGHHDYFTGGKSYSAAVAQEGGQRTWTAMVFLNEPEVGGSTNFERAGVSVPPRTGTLLTWNNMGRDGLPNSFTRHEGSRVEGGTKHVLTKWFREREWRKLGAGDAHGS